MAYSEVPSVSTGDLWTAANHNTYLRDNLIDHETRILANAASITTLQGTGTFLIEEQILSTTSNLVTIDNIPQTYRNLNLICDARIDLAGSASVVKLLLNNDETNNAYGWQYIQANNAGISADDYFGYEYMEIMKITASTALANSSAYANIFIPNYAGTVFNKKTFTMNGLTLTSTEGGFYLASFAGNWFNASAINRIDLIPWSNSNFITGSTFSLYGIV
jgi:hypothetical protein